MRRVFFYILALVIVVSCESNLSLTDKEPGDDRRMITEVISGGHGASTKATIADADASFAWTEGDNIAVHVSNGTSHKYVRTSGGGGASAAAATADFVVSYEEGYSRDAFAVFPSTIVSADAANYGQSGSPLDVTLPGSYTLAQVSGTTTPCPMIADNTGTNWTFYQLCGLLRLTVSGIPSSSKRLEIDFDGKQVWGDFSVSIQSPLSTSVIATAADDAHDVITITKGGSDVVLGVTSLVANIPLPVGTYTNFTVTAYDALADGNATIVLSRAFAYTASNQNATKRTASSPSSMTAFRGYEVSAGILERTKSGDADATYSLTSGAMILTADPVTGAEYYSLPAGCNPFEPAIYYKKSASLNKYFLKWLTLREELGADGNNISATSVNLPDGWQFPTGGNESSDWGKILFGTPKSTITVNGLSVTNNAYAMVLVTLESSNSYSVAAGTYYGMLLLRDGTTIPTGYLTKVGSGHKYSDNPLDETHFNTLVQLGCLFISATGVYDEEYNIPGSNPWRGLNSSHQEGIYWSSTYRDINNFIIFKFDETGSSSAGTWTSNSHKKYRIVKLVKPVTD